MHYVQLLKKEYELAVSWLLPAGGILAVPGLAGAFGGGRPRCVPVRQVHRGGLVGGGGSQVRRKQQKEPGWWICAPGDVRMSQLLRPDPCIIAYTLVPPCQPQVSLGLVWPTLMVWQGQLAAAREWAVSAADQEARQAAQLLQQQARQQAQQQQQQDGDLTTGPPAAATAAAAPPGTAVAEYERSMYARLCAPGLSVARACPGGWAMVVALAALYPYLASVLTEPQCPK